MTIPSSKNIPYTKVPFDGSTILDHGALDEVIKIYSNLQPDTRRVDAIHSTVSEYTHQTVWPVP